MSLPNDEVLELLESEFVLGNRNIEKEEHVGMSHGYKKTQTAVGTTNGAGGRNVQIIVMATDSTVLHVLPGYWHADDLVAELKFALRLHELYRDERRSEAGKVAMFEAMHRSFVRRLSDATRGRSRWQHFDAHYEQRRSKGEYRDTFARDRSGEPVEGRRGLQMKPVCDLVHDRMIARPFVAYDEFDMEDFVDYGRPYYDNNMGHERGKSFAKAIQANKKRERKNEEEARKFAKQTPHTR